MTAKWAHVSGHIMMKAESKAEEKTLSALPLCPELTQYYRTLFSSVTSPSNTIFQVSTTLSLLFHYTLSINQLHKPGIEGSLCIDQ